MTAPATAAPDIRRIAWAHGEAALLRHGAMLAPVCLRAPGLPDLRPLHVAPWDRESGLEALPPALRWLRGDWPCVPFGRCDRPDGLPADWGRRDPGDAFGHGYPVHHAWEWIETGDPLALALGLDVPGPGPVSRIERTVRADPAAPRLRLGVRVQARHAATVPLALHPTFSLAQGPVVLRPGAFRAAHAYPVPAEPGVSRLRPGAQFASLEAAPGIDGPFDLSRLPLDVDTEELLQLESVPGQFALDYTGAGWRVELRWPAQLLPDVMLWVSNRGRGAAPWSGRHVALGVEPVNGLFDLGRVASAAAGHPLAARHGVALDPAQPLVIDYEIDARPLPGG